MLYIRFKEAPPDFEFPNTEEIMSVYSVSKRTKSITIKHLMTRHDFDVWCKTNQDYWYIYWGMNDISKIY